MLKLQSKKGKPSTSLPKNYDQILKEAILLKREVPTRSINQIILILEMEGHVDPGVLSHSTLQRHLYEAGYGKKQMKKYSEARTTSSGRFNKPHRMMLLQMDIKYGIYLPIGPSGKPIRTYFSAAIDDHSRYLVPSGFMRFKRPKLLKIHYIKQFSSLENAMPFIQITGFSTFLNNFSELAQLLALE